MQRTTTNRPRRLLRALAVAVVAACALPAGASAAMVEFNSDEVLHRGIGSERNNVSVREVPGALIVTDTAGLSHNPNVSPQLRCAVIDSRTMRCPLKRFETHMGNGDDTAGPMNTRVAVEINGEADNDTYRAGNPSFLTNVEFVGGTSTDFADYSGSGGASGGRGVRVAIDGQPNDGRPGLDTDNIGLDVEEVIGTSLADDLTAGGRRRPPFGNCCVRLRGGPGADVMRAGDGEFSVVFEMGPVADGPDKIISGGRFSIIDYGDRTRPVTGTMNSGGADDGEAGEGDEIIGDHDHLDGGSAGDILSAPRLSLAQHVLFGKAGNDLITGAEGRDIIEGNAGSDTVRVFGGDDLLVVQDGTRDTVECGPGTDEVEVDGIDSLSQCENGTIGVLRLAPKALLATAGETAKLRLSWRHPGGWKQLRSVTLRVYRGKARVGAVAIKPGNSRIEGRGAVKVLRPTRLTRDGKTVSAQLALRLDRKLAGKRLRLEVEAVDVRGARQLERAAGSIRVAR